MSIKTLGDITRLHRQERPDETALVYTADNRSWSFLELDREACQCANALTGMGIGSQDRVAYLDKNSPEYFTCLYGAAKLGAVSVAVNWRLAPPEMEYILNHSEAKVLLIGDEFLGHLGQMNLQLDQIVVIGDPGDSGHPTYEQWIAGADEEDPNCPVSPSDTCYQLYTSGTTGLPKGVETTHENFLTLLDNGLADIGASASSVTLVCMPLFHISGSGWGVLGNYFGAKSILLRDVDLPEILRSVPDYRVTHTIFVPAVLQFLLSVDGVEKVDFSSLEAVVYGASPITEAVLTKAMQVMGKNFYQVYGLTETTGGITILLPEDHDPGGPKSHLLRSCGKAIKNHEFRIVDPESGAVSGEGEVGEILIRGPQVMKGYWKNPESTKSSIDEDGWFHSGDAGYQLDGYLYIHDRVKDMIISGGENIYPAEIENVLMKHPGIKDAAVIGVPDERWGETVKAIITRASEELTDEDVISFCRQQLAHYKCPTSVDWLPLIPRNPSGKILKTELRKPYWKGADRFVH